MFSIIMLKCCLVNIVFSGNIKTTLNNSYIIQIVFFLLKKCYAQRASNYSLGRLNPSQKKLNSFNGLLSFANSCFLHSRVLFYFAPDKTLVQNIIHINWAATTSLFTNKEDSWYRKLVRTTILLLFCHVVNFVCSPIVY